MNEINDKLAAIRAHLDAAADGAHEIGNILCALSILTDVVEKLAAQQRPPVDDDYWTEYQQAKEQAQRFLAAESGDYGESE